VITGPIRLKPDGRDLNVAGERKPVFGKQKVGVVL